MSTNLYCKLDCTSLTDKQSFALVAGAVPAANIDDIPTRYHIREQAEQVASARFDRRSASVQPCRDRIVTCLLSQPFPLHNFRRRFGQRFAVMRLWQLGVRRVHSNLRVHVLRLPLIDRLRRAPGTELAGRKFENSERLVLLPATARTYCTPKWIHYTSNPPLLRLMSPYLRWLRRKCREMPCHRQAGPREIKAKIRQSR